MLRITLRQSKYHILATLILLCCHLPAFAGHCVQWPSTLFQPNPFTNRIAAHYGIEWLKSNGHTETATPACTALQNKSQCMQQLEEKGYYSPFKPTIIFIHGWQPGTVIKKSRFDFCYQYKQPDGNESPVFDTLQYWKGWNVGVFYWNQFADEDDVVNAEKKIYTTSSDVGMRWAYLNSDGKVEHCTQFDGRCTIPKESVIDLAFDAFKNALPDAKTYNHFNNHRELRIAGQSLGTQVAIQLTHKIMSDQSLPQPTRLTLMDPYFSSDNNTGFIPQAPNDTVAQYNTTVISQIESQHNHQFPIDVYRTSSVSFAPLGDPAPQLMDQVDFLRLNPLYLSNDPSDESLLELHESSIYLYFESMQPKPFGTKRPFSPASFTDAHSSDQQIVKLLGQKRMQLTNDASYDFTKTYDEIFSQPLK